MEFISPSVRLPKKSGKRKNESRDSKRRCNYEKEKSMRENLKHARKSAGMTKKQVAEHLGITAVAYGRIELGQRIGRIEVWDKLEDLFGIHQRVLREDSGQH